MPPTTFGAPKSVKVREAEREGDEEGADYAELSAGQRHGAEDAPRGGPHDARRLVQTVVTVCEGYRKYQEGLRECVEDFADEDAERPVERQLQPRHRDYPLVAYQVDERDAVHHRRREEREYRREAQQLLRGDERARQRVGVDEGERRGDRRDRRRDDEGIFQRAHEVRRGEIFDEIRKPDESSVVRVESFGKKREHRADYYYEEKRE